MRLKEIYHSIQPNIDELKIDRQQRTDNTSLITNVKEIANAVLNIENTGLFNIPIQRLKDTKLYEGFTDAIVVTPKELNIISDALSALKFSCIALIDALEAANIDLEGEEFGVEIKLPNELSFHELSKLFDQLKKSIEQPVKELPEGGELIIKNFDSGSYWIDIVLPSLASLLLVGRIIYSGVAIQNKRHQVKASEAYVQGLKIQSEWLDGIQDLGEKQIELLIEAEAKIIEKESYSDHDIERVKRLTLAIKETSDLISKGVTMHPSLATPEDASKIFPDFSLKGLIEPRGERIEDAKK